MGTYTKMISQNSDKKLIIMDNRNSSRMKPKLPPLKMVNEQASSRNNQPQTAAIMEDTILELPDEEEIETKGIKRTYSLSTAKPLRNQDVLANRPKLNRQKTL